MQNHGAHVKKSYGTLAWPTELWTQHKYLILLKPVQNGKNLDLQVVYATFHTMAVRHRLNSDLNKLICLVVAFGYKCLHRIMRLHWNDLKGVFPIVFIT